MAFAPVFGRVFSPTFDRRAAAAAPAGNGLLNNLVAYWPLDEASGDAYDAHTNGLTLTDRYTVTSAAGIVYATARQYTRANTEYHERTSETLLQVGSTQDFTLAAWVYLDSKPGQMYIANKGGAGSWEYAIDYEADRFRFWFYNGSPYAQVVANTLGSPATGQWYFVVGWNDHNADTVSIQISGGTVDTVARGGALPFADSNPFLIGAIAGAARFDGRIGPVAFWKSAAGGGGALSADQRDALYNSGVGLAYAAFTT